jgi:hypothetical protein
MMPAGWSCFQRAHSDVFPMVAVITLNVRSVSTDVHGTGPRSHEMTPSSTRVFRYIRLRCAGTDDRFVRSSRHHR